MGEIKIKQSYNVYLDEKSREKLHEIKQHIEENYGGISSFVQAKIQEEQPLSIEQKIQQAKQEEREAAERRKQLEQIHNERQEQSALRDKRELLEQKQEKLQELDGAPSKDVVRSRVEDEMLERKPSRFSDEEYLEKKKRQIDRRVESRLDEMPDVEQLVEDIQRLQDEICDLNGGEDLDCFMDVEPQEQEVRSS